MISFEEIQKYLPKYLSQTAEQKLFGELEQFPDNIDKRFYTYLLKEEVIIYQGDGFKDVMIINLPDLKTGNAPVLIVSNTCDIDPGNIRFLPARIIYSPIFNLAKYKESLLEEGLKDSNTIEDHIDAIRKQFISHIFYLPPGGDLPEESLVFLDRVNNLPVGYIPNDEIVTRRLFTLSDYGFYVFLFKLSVHFTRMREGFERGMEEIQSSKKGWWSRLWN